jgi:hypothetical protein
LDFKNGVSEASNSVTRLLSILSKNPLTPAKTRGTWCSVEIGLYWGCWTTRRNISFFSKNSNSFFYNKKKNGLNL